MDDENWFSGFAAIPEINYVAPKGLDFSHLAKMKITPEIRDRYSDIEWQSMTSFRNIIVHAYFSLDLDIVWGAATTEGKTPFRTTTQHRSR